MGEKNYIRRVGVINHSYYITIPKDFAEALRMTHRTHVNVKLGTGKFTVALIYDPKESKKNDRT